MRLDFTVTQEELDNSVRRSEHYCAVACALRKRLFSNHIAINKVLWIEGAGQVTNLPFDVKKYIEAYDNNEDLEPTMLSIWVPRWLVKPEYRMDS
jgi:hypothetical protein